MFSLISMMLLAATFRRGSPAFAHFGRSAPLLATSASAFATVEVSAFGEQLSARGMATIPATMRAVVPEDGRCKLVERPVPSPGPNEVLLKVHYSAVNRADTLQRKGLYPPPPGATDVMGLEAAGEVAAVGTNVIASAGAAGDHSSSGATSSSSSSIRVGMPAMALLSGGGYAEYVNVHAGHVMPIPASLLIGSDSPASDAAAAAAAAAAAGTAAAGALPSYRTAGAIPETWLTAYQLLFMVGQGKAGDTVLIHAAGSGVGTAAVQLATAAGMSVIAVAGDDGKLDLVKGLGAKHGLNYKTSDFAAGVKEITDGKGVNLILDPVGASFWKQNGDSIGIDGRWVVYGSMGGLHIEGSLLGVLLRKRATITGTTLRNRSDEYKAQLVSAFTQHALPKLADGTYKPVIDAEFPIEEVQAAHDLVESNKTTGKVLLRVA